MTPWRIFRAAALADARALRLLGPGAKVAPTDLGAALADADYLEMRERESERAREYRARKKAAA